MSLDEFRTWIARQEVEPLPDPHAIGAMIACVIARVMGGPRNASLTPAAFLPRGARQERAPVHRREESARLFAGLAHLVKRG